MRGKTAITASLIVLCIYSFEVHLEPAFSEITVKDLSKEAYGLTVDSRTDRLYVLECDPNRILTLNATSLEQLESINLGEYCPYKIKINSESNKLYVTAYDNVAGSAVSGHVLTKVFDGTNKTLLKEMPNIRVEAIDERSNLIFFMNDTVFGENVYEAPSIVYGNERANSLIVVNGTNDRIIQNIRFGTMSIISASVDATRDKVYCIIWSTANQTAPRTLIAIDERHLSIIGENITLDSKASKVLVNYVTGTVYVVNFRGLTEAGGKASVTVIKEGNSKSISNIEIEPFPLPAALDTTSNQLYVVNLSYDIGYVTLTDIDGNPNAIKGRWVIAAPDQMTFTDAVVDSTSHRIFLSSQTQDPTTEGPGRLIVIDGNTEFRNTESFSWVPIAVYSIAIIAIVLLVIFFIRRKRTSAMRT